MTATPRNIPVDTKPLAPYIPYGEEEPLPTTRMSHMDCLNPEAMRTGLLPNTVCLLNQMSDDTEFGVVNVYSPYADLHLMMLNLGAKHCPGPLCLTEEVGSQIMTAAAKTLGFFRECGAEDVFLGWNFSPWSWGEAEMRSGGQSFPTRFHPHLGGRRKGEEFTMEWGELSSHERRLLGENDYGYLLGEAIFSALEPSPEFMKLISIPDSYADNMGLVLPLRRDLVETVASDNFFAALAIVADAAEETIAGLNNAITSLSGRFICHHLRRVEQGSWENKDLELLMADPTMRSREVSLDLFSEYRFDPQLLDVLTPYIAARCARDESKSEDWWRKGFAYSAVFHYMEGMGPVLRVAPFVTVGACGLHEAQGRLLRRPLDYKMPAEKVLERSQLLWDLADQLRTSGLAV